MKVCSKCKQEKDLDEFHKCKSKRDGRQPYCKICLNKNSKRDYRENNRKDTFAQRAKIKRREVRVLFDHIRTENACALCGEDTACCLDFHHPNPQEKEASVAYFAYAKSKPRMIAEMKKCVVLCSNCHRKVHAGLLKVDKSHLCEVDSLLT